MEEEKSSVVEKNKRNAKKKHKKKTPQKNPQKNNLCDGRLRN